MGHHKDIHKNIYRVPVPILEMTDVSRLLMAAIGYDDKEDDKEDNEEYSDDNQNSNSSDKENEHITSAMNVMIEHVLKKYILFIRVFVVIMLSINNILDLLRKKFIYMQSCNLAGNKVYLSMYVIRKQLENIFEKYNLKYSLIIFHISSKYT